MEYDIVYKLDRNFNFIFWGYFLNAIIGIGNLVFSLCLLSNLRWLF